MSSFLLHIQIVLLKHLKDLTYLDLSDNEISDIRYLEDLKGLISLDLSDNKISDISFFQDFNDLTSLDLSFNEIIDVSVLEHLNGLESLNICYNSISDIRFLEDLKGLKYLDLRNNEIRNISSLIPLMESGVEILPKEIEGCDIKICNNPIASPPINIVEQGREAVLDWFSQVDEDGAFPFYESKLMVLGQGGGYATKNWTNS